MTVVKQETIYFLKSFYKREEFPVEHNQPGFSAKSLFHFTGDFDKFDNRKTKALASQKI